MALATAMEESRGALQDGLSGEREERADLAQKSHRSVQEVSQALNDTMQTIRDELQAGLGRARADHERLEGDLEKAKSAFQQESDGDLTSMLNSSIQALQDGLSAEREERADLARSLDAVAQEGSQSLHESICKVRDELRDGVEKTRVDYERLQGELEKATSGFQQELRADYLRIVDSSIEDASQPLHEAMRKVQDESREQLERARVDHERLEVTIRDGLKSQRDAHADFVATCNSSLQTLQNELCEEREERAGLAQTFDSSVQGLQDVISKEREERASLARELDSCAQEASQSLNEAVLKVREELREGIEKGRVDCARAEEKLENAPSECAGSAEKLQNSIETLQDGLCAEREERVGLARTLDSSVQTLRDLISKESEERESFGRTVDASVLEVSQSLHNAILQARDELCEGIDKARADFEKRACDLEKAGRERYQEHRSGVGEETVAEERSGDKLAELTRMFESSRKETQQEIENMRERVNQFCEEIVEMVADLNHQACGGCVEVQQALEVAVTQLGACNSDVQARLQSLESHSALSAPGKLSAAEDTFGMHACAGNAESRGCIDQSVAENLRRLDSLEAKVEAHSDELRSLPKAFGDHKRELRALEEQLSNATSAIRKDELKLEHELGDCASRLEEVTAAVGRMRAQLDMSEARIDVACKVAHNTSVSSSPIRLERQLEASSCELATSPATLSEAQGQLAILEERFDGQVISLDRRLDIIEEDLAAWPQTVADVQSQLNLIQDSLKSSSREDNGRELPQHQQRVDEPSNAAADSEVSDLMTTLRLKVASHDEQLIKHATVLQSRPDDLEASSSRLAALEDGFQDLVSLRDTVSQISGALESLEGRSLASQSTAAKMQASDQRQEAQIGDFEEIRQAIADLTNDVLKAQGGADAAYAEATREQEWAVAIQASAEAIRREFQTKLEQSASAWKAILADAVHGECEAVAGAVAEKAVSNARNLYDELRSQCRRWVDEVADKAGAPTEQLTEDIRMQCHDLVQDQLSEVARSQARQQELLRSEVERARDEAQAEVNRLWEAVGSEAGGSSERSEALAIETQRQCRTWVDGALRKLEDLALRTKERLNSLAAAAEQREARLEARLDEALRATPSLAYARDALGTSRGDAVVDASEADPASASD